MDYAFAMRQALSHYSIAGREDRHAAVQSKARSLAEPLATGNDWMAAVELYEIAGDYDRAESLRAQRERSAQATEATRQETFRKEQADLEKELGL
jgi:hypothetical protein